MHDRRKFCALQVHRVELWSSERQLRGRFRHLGMLQRVRRVGLLRVD